VSCTLIQVSRFPGLLCVLYSHPGFQVSRFALCPVLSYLSGCRYALMADKDYIAGEILVLLSGSCCLHRDRSLFSVRKWSGKLLGAGNVQDMFLHIEPGGIFRLPFIPNFQRHRRDSNQCMYLILEISLQSSTALPHQTDHREHTAGGWETAPLLCGQISSGSWSYLAGLPSGW
jgi:hypothetical protein